MNALKLFGWAVAIGISLPILAAGASLAWSLLLDARDEWRERRG